MGAPDRTPQLWTPPFAPTTKSAIPYAGLSAHSRWSQPLGGFRPVLMVDDTKYDEYRRNH
jgi:hypothetical protein